MRRRWMCVVMAALLAAAAAEGYGPSNHMREANLYILLCRLASQPGLEHHPALLSRYRSHLLLGAVWPDIARVLLNLPSGDARRGVDEDSVDPHNRHFNRYLLDQALADYPEEPWRVAFAVGCLIHNTGDLVAQDLLVPHLAVRGGLGELDALPGLFDGGAGSEVEGLIEGGLEFMYPATNLYARLSRRFLGTVQGRDELGRICDHYFSEYTDYFELPAPARRETSHAELEGMLGVIPWDIPNHGGDPRWYRFARSGMRDVRAIDGLVIDWHEIARVFGGPAGTSAFWFTYWAEGYFLLSPAMMLTFREGQGYYDWFPNWSSRIMKSGVLQSLNTYLPGQFAVEDGRFVMDLVWRNEATGQPITEIDASTPPARVSLTVWLFDVPGRSGADTRVTLRVVEDSDQGEVVAGAATTIDFPVWDAEQVMPVAVAVEFAPALSIARGARGFHAELVPGEDLHGPAWFTSNWQPYAGIQEVDMSKEVYRRHYATYDRWPHSLRVVGGNQ